MSPPPDTHPNPPARRNAGRGRRRHNNRSTKAKQVEHATDAQPNVQATVSSRTLKRRRQRQRQRERDKQERIEQAKQASRPATSLEWPSLRCTRHRNYPAVPLSPCCMSASTLASLPQETNIVDRDTPLGGFEAGETIEYPEDEPLSEGTEVEEGVAVEGSDIFKDGATDPFNDLYTFFLSMFHTGEYGESLRAWYERHKKQPYDSYLDDVISSDGEPDDNVHHLTQREQKVKNEQRALEITKIEEVQNVHQSLKAYLKKTVRRRSIRLANTHFRLYSTDYFDHCYNPAYYPSKYVEFYYLKDDFAQMFGHLYLHADCGMDFEGFSPLIFPSPDGVNIPSFNTKHDCNIKFLSNDHLILMLSRDVVFGPKGPPPEAPHYFTFFGLRVDRERERAKREHQARGGQSMEEGCSFPNSLCYD